MFQHRSWLLLLLILFLTPSRLAAHANPETPVRTDFLEDGSVMIRIELELRTFAEDPEQVQYTYLKDLLQMDESQREDLRQQARAYTRDSIEFLWSPSGSFEPAFAFDFTARNNAPLLQAYDHVVLTGTWTSSVPDHATGYRIRAHDEARFEVYFLNYVSGTPLQRFQVLFAGEESFELSLQDLTALERSEGERGDLPQARARNALYTFQSFVRMGFVHVVPHGWDHILFVLGIFLLSRHWKPLLLQVTTFTLAHSITLALASFELIRLPAEIVEPVIAVSIIFVAVENLYRPEYQHRRLLLVFAFGLIHGLGFAGVLGNLQLLPASLVVSLLGFNVGVELGQLAVILTALLLVFWVRPPHRYRRWVAVPGSILIALMGLWWVVERTLLA